MLSIVLIETSAAKECEVDCRKLSQVSQEKGYHECQRGVCGAVQREITRATICEVWLRRSAGTRSVKLCEREDEEARGSFGSSPELPPSWYLEGSYRASLCAVLRHRSVR
jgi:hypothetical protein